MKILVIGPSPTKSKGGMATVIGGIEKDETINVRFCIDVYESYIDGNIVIRTIYCIYKYVKFILKMRNYDIYHIHVASRGSTFRKGYYVRAAKKWGKKVIVHIHGAQYMEFYSEQSPRKKNKVIGILQSADMVIALSDSWKERFEKTFGLMNCVSLPNGIDTNEFVDAVCDMGENRNAFLFLGRLGKRKGAYDLVSAVGIAVKQNPNLKLFMAGDGEIEKVKMMITQKGLNRNIEVVGWVDRKGKIDLLNKVATVVLPSYNEGLPMAVLEGMASGKAIISTIVGAIPEVVKENNGILIQPGDIKSLANALVKCSSDVEMIKQMSIFNINKIDQQFSMKKMHEVLQKYYEAVYKMR